MIWVAERSKRTGRVENYLHFDTEDEANEYMSFWEDDRFIILEQVDRPNTEWLIEEKDLVQNQADNLRHKLNQLQTYNTELEKLI